VSTTVERQICLKKKSTAVDDRVHVDDGGVERLRWVCHVGLGQTKRAHGGGGV
jgi:hypothetical protein